jgi:hypothetical protein
VLIGNNGQIYGWKLKVSAESMARLEGIEIRLRA